MQELIQHFEDFKKHSPNVKLTLDEIINLLKDNLEKEKEHTIDFHVMLMKHGLEQEGNGIEWNYDELRKEAEDYYNQTYNQNK